MPSFRHGSFLRGRVSLDVGRVKVSDTYLHGVVCGCLIADLLSYFIPSHVNERQDVHLLMWDLDGAHPWMANSIRHRKQLVRMTRHRETLAIYYLSHSIPTTTVILATWLEHEHT